MSISSKKKRVLIPLATLSIASLLVGSSYFGNDKTDASAATSSYSQGEAFESGGYSAEASLPVVGNWSYNLTFAGTNTNKVKWSKEVSNYSLATPTVDKDGNIYVMNMEDEVVSYDKDGNERWKFQDNSHYSPYGSLVIGTDNTLYYSSGPCLIALNADGTVKWRTTFIANFKQTPAIDKDGTIYAYNNSDNKLYAINPDGSMKWKTVAINDGVADNKSPLISKDGTIYVQGSPAASYLTAVDKNGQIKWKKPSSGYLSNYSLLPTGEILSPAYMASSVGYVNIVNPSDGTIDKTIKFTNKGGRFAVYSEFTHDLIVQNGNEISSYDLDGNQKWTYQTNGQVMNTPLIDKNGVIYFSSQDGTFTALNPDGKVKWFVNLKEYYGASNVNFLTSPTSFGIDKNGTFYTMVKASYVGADSKYFFLAIGDDGELEQCSGYLETVKQKLKDHSLTQEEIDAAQADLSDVLTQLNEEENK